MHISLKSFLLPTLGIICLLGGWQGIGTHSGEYAVYDVTGSTGVPDIEIVTQVVAPVDTGISESAGPEDSVPKATLYPADSTRYFLSESPTAQSWLSERIAAMQSVPVVSSKAPVIVAILDTGIDKNHEDLGGAVIGEINFTDSPTADDIYGHGTHVAGIIAAEIGNDIGIDGIAADCQLLNVKVADDQGKCRMSVLVEGIIWAVEKGARVINISIEMGDSSPILQEAIDYAWESGAIVIAAAGNSGSDLPVYPAGCGNCLSVTALKDNGELAPLSNYGNWVDAAAPGYKIYSTLPGDEYGYKCGTSFAAAYISGLSAWLFPLTEDANGNGRINDEIRQIIDTICGNDFVSDATT
jgi:subtilisin family serine protease